MKLDGRVFVGIGAQKAGTTWLYRVLGEHPDVWVSYAKELHYFDQLYCPEVYHNSSLFRTRARGLQRQLEKMHPSRALRKLKDEGFDRQLQELTDQIERAQWFGRFALEETVDDEWYAKQLEPGEAWPLRGEITPAYSMLPPEGFAHMARLSPDARILFMLREPVSRIWSHLRMASKEKQDPGMLEPDEAILRSKRDAYLLRSDYGRTLRNVCSAFPAEQLHVVFYEDMAENHDALVKGVYDFLDLSMLDTPSVASEVHNASPAAAIPERFRKVVGKRCERIVDEVEEFVGRVPASWRSIGR